MAIAPVERRAPNGATHSLLAHLVYRAESIVQDILGTDTNATTKLLGLPCVNRQKNISGSYILKIPPKRKASPAQVSVSEREVSNAIDTMIEICGVNRNNIIKRQMKKVDDNKVVLFLDKLSEEEKLSLGLLMMRVGNLTGSKYHETRMLWIWRFGKEVVEVIGPPLEHIRLLRRKLASPDDMFHGEYQLVSTGGASKKCSFWLFTNYLDRLAYEMATVTNGGRFVSSTEFSHGSDNDLHVSLNDDADTLTLAFMGRILNQIAGNSGERIFMLSQIKGNPSEMHSNLEKYLLTVPPGLLRRLGLSEEDLISPTHGIPANPLHTFKQSLYDSGVVDVRVDVHTVSGNTVMLHACAWWTNRDLLLMRICTTIRRRAMIMRVRMTRRINKMTMTTRMK